MAASGGIAATLLDSSALALLLFVGAPVAPAAFMAALLGAALGFAMNKFVAFADGSPVDVSQVARYAAVAVVNAAITAALMRFAVEGLKVPPMLAKAVCAAVVFAIWSYPAQRRFVFARPGVRL